MAIPSYEGIAYNTAFASSNTVDISGIDGGSPPTTGDLLIAQICLPNANPNVDEFVYPPSGWHILGGYQNASRDVVFWKIRESGDSNSVQFSYPGIGTLNSVAYIHCIRGADKARPIARHSINYEDSGTYNWLAETTPVADCLAIASANLVEGNNTGASPASGWTERLDVGIGVLLDEVTCYVQTKGIASASTSTGNPSTDIPGITSYAYTAHMMVIQPPQTATPKDVRIATGTFASPTSTGNQDITGLGFDCKALIIYGTRNNLDSAVTDIEYTHGIGADDGVTTAAQRSFGVWHDSGSGAAGYSRNGEIIALYIAGNSTVGSPDLLATYSRITDGFRLNWSAVMGSGYAFSYIAFGGSDVQAAVGAALCSAGAVSGLNFRPDALHIIGQCLDSDSDQLRTAAGIGNAGWVDCQAGAQCYSFVGTEETGQPDFIYRHSGFYGQTTSGTANYEISFEQTTSSGWTWVGTNADYFFYLALYFGGTTYFPYQVETLVADNSGTGGADQYLPSFGLDQTYGTKKLIHALTNRDGTDVGIQAGGCSEGHVKFSYTAVDQDGMALGKTGSTSERRRKTFEGILMHSSGDLNSPGKVGRFYYPDYIDWSTNNTVDHLICLFTLGFIGQVYTRTINDTASVSDSIAAVMEFDRINLSDTASVTDSTARAWEANRTQSDTASTSDQIATELEYGRTASDSLSTTDSVAAELEFGRTLSDSVSISDATARDWQADRTISDAASVNDQSATVLEYGRTVSDSTSVADQISRSWEANRTISDSVSTSDQLGVEMTFERSNSDSVSVSDQLHKEADFFRGDANSVSVTDTLQRSWEANRTISDSSTVNDQTQRSWEANRTQSDWIITTDTTKTNRILGRSSADSVSTSDQIVANLESGRSASDSVSTSDQLNRVFDSVRTISDSVSLSEHFFVEIQGYQQDSISIDDELHISLVYSRTISDFSVTTDTTKPSLAFSRSAVDSLNVADSVAVEMELGAKISDSISTSDQVARVFNCIRTISDSTVMSDTISVETQRDGESMVGVMDQLKVSMTFGRLIRNWVVPYDTFKASLIRSYAISDTVNASDESIKAVMSYGRAAGDSINVSDSLSTEFEEGSIRRIVSDSVSTSDQVANALSYSRSASDSASTSDQISEYKTLGVEISDSISTSDAIQRSWESYRALSDSVSVSDQASAGIFDLTFSDTAVVNDSVLKTTEYDRSTSDSVSVSDQIQIAFSGTVQITIDDSVSLSEQLSRSHESSRTVGDFVSTSDSQESSFEIALSDTISTSDQLSRVADFDKTVSDFPTVSEQLTREHDASRYINDTSEVSDTIDISLGGIISLSDTIPVSDQTTIEMYFGRTISDSPSVTDQLTTSLEKIFYIVINDSAAVSELPTKEHQASRTISDSASVTDSLQYQAPSFDVKIYDSISVIDEANASLEKVGSIQDTAGVSDSLSAVLILGGQAADSISISDSITADLLFVPPDAIDLTDSLLIEAQYNRELSDVVETEDVSYSGEPILVIHGILNGANYGDSKIHTVNPTGPLSISGGRICSPIPTGFVENNGDVLEYNDSLKVDMYYNLVINDSVETAG